MGIFARKRENGAGAAVQLREGGRHPFGVLDGYVPLSQGEMELYRSIREAVPIVDAALRKLVRLAGGVKVSCRESAAQEGLDWFLQHVNTGRGQRGIQSFLDGYLDSMLTFGRAVGEIVPDRRGREIAAVLCGNPADVEIREGESPLEFTLWGRDGDGQLRELPRQELLLFTPFQPEVGSPYGVSLLRSMPFLTGILLNIYQAMGMNWERMGNVRFAVVYKPGDAPLEQSMAQERSRQIAREWSAAMEAGRAGRVRDFVAVGDVDIKVIGADNQVLDSEVPVRQILEQFVVENLPIAGQGVHRLLNAGAAGVAQAHHGAARLQSHVHDFTDFGRVHLAQRSALGGKVLSVYKNRAPVDLAVTGNHAVGRDVLIPHTEGGTAVAHKAVHLCKSAGIHQQFNPFTGRPLPQRVLLLHRFRAAAPQHTGRMRVKLSQLFRRSHCPHFLSHNSSRTPWVALGWRKAIRAPPAPYRGVWSMSRTPFSFNSARAASMSSTRMAMC